jgi:peptidoglycan/LPS O-acetylase OafA/YrhL
VVVADHRPSDEAGSVQAADPPASDSDKTRTPFVLGNRPALTGLRAPMIATILIFHANFTALIGAWAAVGSFFVLSGFLITTMLTTEQRKTGGINLKKFYSRRAVRLLPPLFVTVAGLIIYANFVKIANAATTLWGDIAAAVFYFADYRAAFGHESAFGFLAQTWSLAIEEQFYVVWAVLLFVALRYGSRRWAYVLALSGIAASVTNRMWIVLHASRWDSAVSGRVYYAFDTRADALLVGCLIGLLATGGHLEIWKPWARRILAAIALGSTGLMVWIICNVTVGARSVPLYWLPVSEVATAVIIVYLLQNPRGVSARVLGLPILVLLGNMSYTIYLIHWPIYVAISPFTVRWPFHEFESVRLIIILAIALASWFLMERPLMMWRRRALDPGGQATEDRAPLPRRPAA